MVSLRGMSLVLCAKVVFRCGTVVGHRFVFVCGETASVFKLSLCTGGHIHTSLTYSDVLFKGSSTGTEMSSSERSLSVNSCSKTLASASKAAAVFLAAN